MLEIRYAGLSDAEALGEVHSESWRAAYKGIVPDEVLEAFTSENRAKQIGEMIAKDMECTAIALKDGKAAGFACIGGCRDEDLGEPYGEVWGIYVKPEYFRSGAGTEILNWSMEELKKRGYKSVSLWVLEQNNRARKFYEKQGFKHDGTKKEIEAGAKLTVVRYIRGI